MKDLGHYSKVLHMLDYLEEGFQLISNEYKYLYVNKAVVAHSKYACKEDLIGFTMMEKYPGIDKTPFFSTLKECMENKTQQNIVNEFDFPDGSTGYFELKVQGVPEGVIVLSTDISSRRRSELEKEDHIDKLEEMMFLTSHKVRTPVSHILGISSLLERKLVDNNDLDRVTDYLKSSITDLDNFTRELSTALYDLKMKVKSRSGE